MRLYHASTKQRTIGEIITIDDFEGDTTYYYQNLSSEQKDLECKFEIERPLQYCSRLKTIFLFAEPAYCYYFANKQYPGKGIYVYEVESNDLVEGFPMCLVNTAYKKLRKGEPYNHIITEYWNPSKEWQVKEYLAKSVRVVRKCNNEHNDLIAKMHYENDCQQAE